MNPAGITTVATAQGPRSYQEDRCCVHCLELADGSPAWLLGVFDGHGGSDVAEYCNDHVLNFFSLKKDGVRAEESIRRAIEELNKNTRNRMSGSTVSLVCILEKSRRAVVAIMGDSPVIIIDAQGKTRISPEHNVRTNKKELEKALRRGGVYDGSYLRNPSSRHGLQLSRALGDCEMEKAIERRPEIYSVELGEKSAVVVTTDGLLDPAHENSESLVEEIVARVKEGANAKSLLRDAEKRGLRDNATVIVWQWK